MEAGYPINRSGYYLLFFQAEGLCEALRMAMQTGQAPGPATIELVKQLRACAQKVGTGEPFDRLPQIEDDSPILDVLVAAEVIRTTMLAFLSPEEIEDQKKSFGFRPG